MVAPSEIPPDTLLAGKIRLIQRIGRGGMGDVWVARNEATQAEVAVKTLQRSERTATHDERFRREARLAATISHRNVVRIFDLVDEADGTLGLVMELLRGGTLEACMRDRGPMTTMHSIAVAAPILSALHHVHQKGIVHRDVKPANIFFAVEPDGHVIPKILDFGIAKLPAATSSLTVDGSVLGTPHYMSPEQIRGQEDLDGRSDMFSLAILLYEMLTGIRIFQRDSAVASLAAVLEHEVDPDPRIEPRVWVAISRALAKRPYERFATCAEFAEALRRAVDASDDDYVHALQELRPRSDALPENELGRLGALSSSSSSSFLASRARKKPKQGKNLVWTLAAAGTAAILAVTATLVITRTGPTEHANDARAAAAAPPSAAAPPAAPGVPASAVSTGQQTVPDQPATPVAEFGADPAPAVTPAGAQGTSAKLVMPTPLARPPGGRALPPPLTGGGGGGGTGTTKKPPLPPPGSGKPVATSPGF